MLQKPANLGIIRTQFKVIPTQIIIKLTVIALVLVTIGRTTKGFTAECGYF
jgi:hypothetical protein